MIPRSFHPFIAGPNNSTINLLQLEHNVRIHIPPFGVREDKGGEEIRIVGEKDQVRIVTERISAMYEDAVSNSIYLFTYLLIYFSREWV